MTRFLSRSFCTRSRSLQVLAPLSALALGVLASEVRAEPILLAQAQTNTPAANPPEQGGVGAPKIGENDEKLTIPVGPEDKTPTPEPNGPAPANTDPTPAPVPFTPSPDSVLNPTPGGETPTTPGGLAATEAEGLEIVEIRVVGNRVVPTQSILLQATTRRGAAFSTVQVDRDRAKIDSLGFFASVQYQVTPNLEDPKKVDLTFIVVENRVVTGFKFESSGSANLQVAESDLIGILETKKDGLLNRATINSDVTKVQNLYRERGFAALVLDVKQGEDGIVVFSIQEAKVSRVDIVGLRKTRPALVRRQIRVAAGDTFDQVKLRRDLNRIYDLGFFEDVTYKIDDDAANPGALILTISLKEKRTGQFTFGVGFDSRSKITGFVSLAENNLRGTGQRAFASVELGAQRTFDVGYGNPFLGKKNASYDVSVFSRRIFREPNLVANFLPGGGGGGNQTFFYEEQRTGGRINYAQPLDLDRTKKLLFGYRNERARLSRTDQSGIITPVTELDESGRISALSTGFLRDRRDIQLEPSRGGREQILLERAQKGLGGNVSFTKIDIDIRRYFPIIKEEKPGDLPKLVLANRLVIGKAFGQLPAFEQYFIGGSETVRGYDVDEQLGDNQIYNNLELRYRFQRKFQVVGFVDVGKATGGRFAREDTILTSFGAGIRLQTPIGPIRLDIGRGRDGIRTHFAIGPTF